MYLKCIRSIFENMKRQMLADRRVPKINTTKGKKIQLCKIFQTIPMYVGCRQESKDPRQRLVLEVENLRLGTCVCSVPVLLPYSCLVTL